MEKIARSTSKDQQHAKKIGFEVGGEIDGATFLKKYISSYELDDVPDDWAKGWCAAIEWSKDRIDEFYGIK